MTTSSTTLNLSLLPQRAQQELLDFYEFLTQKYRVTTEPAVTPSFAAFLQSPIKVPAWIPYTREALHER